MSSKTYAVAYCRVSSQSQADEGISLEEVEKTLIIKALAKADNNRTKAAKLLQVPRHVLIYRIEKFDLK